MLARRLSALTLFASLTIACGTPYLPARVPAEVAQPDGSKHDQGEFMGVAKTALYWQSWTPTKTRKRGALVVMHGLKDHSARYADFAHALNQGGYAVYAFDLRGHGESAGDRVNVLMFDDYVMDFDIFLYRVMLEENVPVFVFGHLSMGGAIVALDEIEYHPAIAGMILSGAALAPGVSSAKIGLTKFTASIDPDLAAFNLDLDQFFARSRGRQSGEARSARLPKIPPPCTWRRSSSKAFRRSTTTWEKIDAPLLILHGKAGPRHAAERQRRSLQARAFDGQITLALRKDVSRSLARARERHRDQRHREVARRAHEIAIATARMWIRGPSADRRA